MRRSNVSAVLQTVLRQGALSRAEIRALTGLSSPAVTKITAELIERRVLSAGMPATSTELGRPRIPVSVDTELFRIAGVHVGLLATRIGLINLRGEALGEHEIAHRGRERDEVLEEAHGVLDALNALPGQRVVALGASAAGWIRAEDGVLTDHPLAAWRGVRLESALARSEYPIFVEGSVGALARAEYFLGAARNAGSVLYLYVGNVVRAAMLIDGEVQQGWMSRAGRIDHLPVGPPQGLECGCGRRDCFTALCTDLGVVHQAREAGVIGRRAGIDLLSRRALRGDPGAMRIVMDRAARIGAACGLLMDFAGPELVVVWGGGIGLDPRLLETVREAAVDRVAGEPGFGDRIVLSGLTQAPLVQASACVALDVIAQDPLAYLTPRSPGHP